MKKTTVQLIDDLDGAVIEPGDGGTVTFAFDGRGYEIDLSNANRTALHDALKPYIDAGRGTAARPASLPEAPRRRARRNGPVTTTSASELAEIRDWARANGHQVGDRGRISAEIREAYTAANR